jgi:DNA-binding SARP family transcriptional activator/tetratricopeptide (TPR) repeat protein
VDFGVLGALRINGRDVVVASKQRVLLAILLLQANRIVPTEALVDALWDDAPPASARTTLQGYVKQLRQHADIQAGKRLVTRSPGYLIMVEAGELDLDRFTGLCDRARLAAGHGDWKAAAGLLGKALALWRGNPLADVPSAVLQRSEVPRLAELRMRAVESRVEAELRLGRHAELVAELRRLAGTEPLREGLHGQLMVALYRCGRQAEALEVFRGIDRQLRDELGICPGPELQRLHQRILAADPALTDGQVPAANEPVPVAGGSSVRPALAADRPVGPGPRAVPAQLPADTADFTGREEQVKLLCGLLDVPADPQQPGAVVISAMTGMGGIGKTALAVHVAHRLRAQFPDGQLHASLQGASHPVRASEVLARFLRDLGEPGEVIPAGEEERAARYRSLLADRKMLIVLDDARDAAQVRPLLPGTASCAVIATSRATLAGLAGAAQVSLDALDPAESRHLFTVIIGASRAAAEPDAVTAVLARCAGLPLAIRIAGARLASRPAWSIAHLAARLAGGQGGLTELTAGDLAVRTSFAVSYQALRARRGDAGNDSADPARVFRLLGLPEMTELPLPAIAALAGQPEREVAGALEALTDACLLQSPAPDRYRMHDLLRSYAAELAAVTDRQEESDAAISRMLHWYGQQVVTAASLLAPDYEFPVVIPLQAGRPAPSNGPAKMLGWYEAERASLSAAVSQAAARGLTGVAAQIPIAAWSFFQRTPYAESCLTMSEAAVLAARSLGDTAALSYALIVLSWAYSVTGRTADADRCLTESLEIRHRTGDRVGETMALNCRAVNLHNQGRFEEAIDCMRGALGILQKTGMHHSIDAAVVQNNLADSLRKLNRHDEALAYLEQALVNYQEAGDLFGASGADTTISQVYLSMGRYDDAVEHSRRALNAKHDTTLESIGEAEALCCLGDALAALGHTDEARDAWQSALPIYDRFRDPQAVEIRARLAGADPEPGSIPGKLPDQHLAEDTR